MLFDLRSGRRWLLRWLAALAAVLAVAALVLLAGWHVFLARWDNRTFAPPPEFVGTPAPDFTLRDLDGQPFHLGEECRKRPVVLEIGSWT
jgi:cytochrome oxidase Cu insertion factor (SCO1/SenC/PrrC family)